MSIPSSSADITALAGAWQSLSNGENTAAATLFRDALAQATDTPSVAEAAFGLAHALAALGANDEAIASLEQALAFAGGDAGIKMRLIQAWAPFSFRERALNPARVGLTKFHKHARARRLTQLRLLADIYEQARDLAGAVAVLYAVITFGERDAATMTRLGQLWLRGGNERNAVGFFEKALGLDPTYGPALDDLATALWIEGDVDGARDALARRVETSTDPVTRTVAGLRRAMAQPAIAMDDAEIDLARKRFVDAISAGPDTLIPDPWRSGLGPNFYANYHARSDRALHESLGAYFLRATPSLGENLVKPRARGSMIRVGMVSNHFSSHVVGYLTRGLITGLDRQRFELVLFRTPNARIDASTAIMADAAPMIDLPHDLAAARRMIAEADLDLLHFPEIGMDHFTYFLAFARLAPLQTTSWGHPLTSGLKTIDLFLSPDAMEPANGAAHYTEQLVRLRELSISVTRPETPTDAPSRDVLGLEANRPAYVCAQNLYKVHPHFDDTIRRILDHDRDGLVYFVRFRPPADARFEKRLARKLGPHMTRVRMLNRFSASDYMQLVRTADVLLDVPQWSGGKTSLEGLAMGTPIVHQPGEFMRGRHTLAFLRKIDVMETVVDTSIDYAETSVRLVHDHAFRDDVRGKIAAHSNRLFNDQASIREIEDVWEKALNERR